MEKGTEEENATFFYPVLPSSSGCIDSVIVTASGVNFLGG